MQTSGAEEAGGWAEGAGGGRRADLPAQMHELPAAGQTGQGQKLSRRLAEQFIYLYLLVSL